ncbi:hypothetical protein JXO52_10540 [bacterium]|nr:hypothetical protein [bacterium]
MKHIHILTRKTLFLLFIIAFLVISIVPLLMYGYHSIRKIEEELKSSLNEKNYLITRQITDGIETAIFNNWLRSLPSISYSLSGLHAGDQSEIDIVNSYFSRDSLLTVLSVLRTGEPEPKHYFNERYLDQFSGQEADSVTRLFSFSHTDPAAIGSHWIGNPLYFPETGPLLLPIEIPLQPSSKNGGVLRGVYQLTPVLEAIDTEAMMMEREIYIVTREGRIIFQNSHGRFSRWQVLPYLEDMGVTGRQNVFQTRSFTREGTSYLGYFTGAYRGPWQVAVIYSRLKAYSQVTQARQQLTFFIALALVLSVAMSLLFAWFQASVIYRAKEALDMVNEQLGSKAAELEEINNELSQYAYIISHDLKAPLRAIHNFSDFLREDLEHVVGDEQRKYLEGLDQAVSQGEELIENLLGFSQISVEDLTLGPVDMGPFFKGLIESINPPEGTEITVDGDLPVLKGEPTLLKQVFLNLVMNGIKFNESPVKKIEIGSVTYADRFYEIFVRDNGIGIDPRYHEQVFDVFRRLHTRDKYEGTGIGLAIVKKAVSKLNGSVRVESEPGKGSTFYVALPNCDDDHPCT